MPHLMWNCLARLGGGPQNKFGKMKDGHQSLGNLAMRLVKGEP